MTTQITTTIETQAVLDRPCCYRAIPCTGVYLSRTEKLEGVAWSVGFRLAWLLVFTVMTPAKWLGRKTN